MIVDTRIEAVVQETPVDRTLRLTIPAEARDAFAFVPGQFVVLHDPAAPEPRRRAYSISSPPSDAPWLEVTVRDAGGFGHALYGLPVGHALAMRAPAGRFLLVDAPDEHVLMAAGGSGVTPFRSFVGRLRAGRACARATLLQSARVPTELVFRETFEGWAADDDAFTYVPTVTRAPEDESWSGRRGRIDEALLASHAQGAAPVRFYACGPAAFVASMLEAAARLGVPAERIHREQWG